MSSQGEALKRQDSLYCEIPHERTSRNDISIDSDQTVFDLMLYK